MPVINRNAATSKDRELNNSCNRRPTLTDKSKSECKVSNPVIEAEYSYAFQDGITKNCSEEHSTVSGSSTSVNPIYEEGSLVINHDSSVTSTDRSKSNYKVSNPVIEVEYSYAFPDGPAENVGEEYSTVPGSLTTVNPIYEEGSLVINHDGSVTSPDRRKPNYEVSNSVTEVEYSYAFPDGLAENAGEEYSTVPGSVITVNPIYEEGSLVINHDGSVTSPDRRKPNYEVSNSVTEVEYSYAFPDGLAENAGEEYSTVPGTLTTVNPIYEEGSLVINHDGSVTSPDRRKPNYEVSNSVTEVEYSYAFPDGLAENAGEEYSTVPGSFTAVNLICEEGSLMINHDNSLTEFV